MPGPLKKHVPAHLKTAMAARVKRQANTRKVDAFYMTRAWRVTRERVLARDLYTCQYCGKTLFAKDAQVDHVVARAEGGSDFDMTNLKACCLRCNSSKGKGLSPKPR